MGLEGRNGEPRLGKAHQSSTVCLHSFSDLSCVSPIVFLYLLKENYFSGTQKATLKFRALQHQIHQILYNDPQPGPATFVVQCLYALPLFGQHCAGFSHLIISSVHRLLKFGTTPADSLKAKQLAASLFLHVLSGTVFYEETIVVKLVEIFDVRWTNIEKVICNSGAVSINNLDKAKQIVEQYILELIEAQSYMSAVILQEQLSIRQYGQSFLFKMIDGNKLKAAEKWAAFMGSSMLHLLVQDHIDKNKLKIAYDIIKRNNLREEFPEVYNKYKHSSIKKLAEKNCWDVAEARAKGDKELIEYLVYLAMEAGYTEKVDELCDCYSLEGFVKAKEPEVCPLQTRFLQFNELVLEDVIWVDEVSGLESATSHIEGCKVIGLDCEWKPNYEKGSKSNKVSIIQIATEQMVYIFDLIKLFKDVPMILDNCLMRILDSTRILKLGYNFECDIQQLSHSYVELECFKHFEMLLDIQKVFKERGGLSGLALKILGANLNKTRRNSNWEQRPLSRNQLEYAALDAAVLIHIFRHVRGHAQPAGVSEEHVKIEWKSYLISSLDKRKKRKPAQCKKEPECETEAYSQLN